MSILDEICDHARARVQADMESEPKQALQARALALEKGGFAFEAALRASQPPALICEVKKASPSKGVIDPVFDYQGIAASYEAAGATCLSVLTEPRWFLGSDDIFKDIRSRSRLPMLRKDFTVDEYQLFQAKCLGADAVLLICAALDLAQLRHFFDICEALGLCALFEAHNRAEIELALQAGARLIGVNNRNLKDFTVDLGNAAALRRFIPRDRLFVAESGVQSPADGAQLARAGADALLIGEALVKAPDRAAFIRDLREGAL